MRYRKKVQDFYFQKTVPILDMAPVFGYRSISQHLCEHFWFLNIFFFFARKKFFGNKLDSTGKHKSDTVLFTFKKFFSKLLNNCRKKRVQKKKIFLKSKISTSTLSDQPIAEYWSHIQLRDCYLGSKSFQLFLIPA